MILLEDTNTLIQSLLLEKLDKPGSMDQLFVDFDSVAYRLSTPEKGNRGIVLLSMGMRKACWDEVVAYGALDSLRREYGDYLQAEAEGNTLRSDGSVLSWDVTLRFDIGPEGLGALPVEEAREAIRKLSMLKRWVCLRAVGALSGNASVACEVIAHGNCGDRAG
jgi:actin related protein 2/3 complex subunit 2